MIPLLSIVEKDKIVQKYKFSDLREFIKQGKETGDVGMIQISRTNDNLVKYKGFGTIEHPFYDIRSIILKHNDIFDGTIGDHRKSELMTTYKFMLIDLSGNKKNQLVSDYNGRTY